MLFSDGVVLRPPTADDAGGRRALGHDAEIARMFGASTPVDPLMTTDQAAAWVASLGGDGPIEWIVEHDGVQQTIDGAPLPTIRPPAEDT
jgi:hypothetical protein